MTDNPKSATVCVVLRLGIAFAPFVNNPGPHCLHIMNVDYVRRQPDSRSIIQSTRTASLFFRVGNGHKSAMQHSVHFGARAVQVARP